MKKLTLYFSLLVIYILVFYATAEFVLARLDLPKEYQRHSAPPQFAAVTDTNVGYVNVPNASIDFIYDKNPRNYFLNNTVSHHTNSFGFRGRDFSISKPSSVVRVLFLGDSFTFGEGVYDSDTYAEQFQILSNEQKVFKYPVEAINLGVGGYNTAQEWYLLKALGSDLKPDFVIVGYTLNDAEGLLFSVNNGQFVRNNREEQVPEGLSTIIQAPNWVSKFRLHKLLWQSFQQKQLSHKTTQHYLDLYRPGEKNWEQTKSALIHMGEWSRENNIPVYVLIFPVLYNTNSHYPFEEIHTILHQQLENSGLKYVDLIDDLKRYNDRDLWVHPTDQHPNEKVHAIAAQKLIELILKKNKT